MGYWIRKFQLVTRETERTPESIFAKLPLELDFRVNADRGNSSVITHFPGNIWIEVGADYPAKIPAVLSKNAIQRLSYKVHSRDRLS